MESVAARRHAAAQWVDRELEPRNRQSATRSSTGMLLPAAAGVGVFLVVAPPGTGPLTYAVAAVVLVLLVVLVVALHRSKGQRSNVLWVFPAVVGLAMITALNLLTDGSSPVAPVFLCFPVLYAASQLRIVSASAVLVLALASDTLINVTLLPSRDAVMSTAFVGSTLVAITVQLVRAGRHDDRLTAELIRLAAIDPLTGLVTRRVLDDAANSALASTALPDGTSLILVDIDHFKMVNDTLGHPAGDAALVHVASVIATVCRQHDVLSRLGGDEIALLLPGCSARTGRERAEMVSTAIRETPMPTAHGPVSLTVSVGVAHAPTDAADLRGLYTVADIALYAAKRGGRDRVGRAVPPAVPATSPPATSPPVSAQPVSAQPVSAQPVSAQPVPPLPGAMPVP